MMGRIAIDLREGTSGLWDAQAKPTPGASNYNPCHNVFICNA